MRLASALCLLALLSSAACGDNRSERNAPVRHIVYWEKWTDFEGEAMDRVVDGFNAMLEQIQKRDAELARHRHRLEELVGERTRDLEARTRDPRSS